MCSSTGPALHSHQAGTGKPAGAGSGRVWGPQVSGARFRMRGAVSGVPGKPHTGPSRPLDKASGSPEEAEECDRNSTPAGALREIRHASHAGMPHGAWLRLDAATGLQQYVGGHGTRLPGWGGCVSGPRFRLPGSRQTDRHNRVLNPEPRTRGQPSERGVNSKPAGSRRTQTSAKGRQLRSASAVTVPQEASARAIETTYFLRHRRQITLPITARVHSRAKVGVRPAPSPSSRSARQARRPGLHRRPCPDLRPRPHRYLCPGFVSRRVSDAYFNRNHRNGLQIHRRTRRST